MTIGVAARTRRSRASASRAGSYALISVRFARVPSEAMFALIEMGRVYSSESIVTSPVSRGIAPAAPLCDFGSYVARRSASQRAFTPSVRL